MTTDLFTIQEDELVDLAALVMDWKKVRQLPVEDDRHRLVGMVSFGAVLRALASRDGNRTGDSRGGIPVREIMQENPPTVEPETSTLDAVRLLREHNVTSLPVVKDGELVGIVSITDFLPVAERLMLEKLGRSDTPTADAPKG